MFAAGGAKRGVHLFNVDPAVRIGRMAGRARLLCRVGVGRVAIQAAQALVHTRGSAVIGGARLAESVGCMALRAEPLARIVRDLDRVLASGHRRDGQQVGGK